MIVKRAAMPSGRKAWEVFLDFLRCRCYKHVRENVTFNLWSLFKRKCSGCSSWRSTPSLRIFVVCFEHSHYVRLCSVEWQLSDESQIKKNLEWMVSGLMTVVAVGIAGVAAEIWTAYTDTSLQRYCSNILDFILFLSAARCVVGRRRRRWDRRVEWRR
jgi:hypothetical protein